MRSFLPFYKPVMLRLGAVSLGLALMLGSAIPANAHTIYLPIQEGQQHRLLTSFYYQAAIESANQGSFELSTLFIEQAYRLNKTDLQSGIIYTQLLLSRGEKKKALKVYHEMLESFRSYPKETASVHYLMSIVYDEMGLVVQAIQALDEAIRIYPGQVPAEFYYDMGVYYSKLDRYDKTKDYSYQAVQVAPESAAAWNNYGYSLAKLGEYEKGYDAIKKSLELDPDNPNTLDSMGYVLFHMGRFTESAKEYEKAVEQNPRLAESYLYLGKSYEALESWPKAIEAYENYVLIANDEAEKARVEKRLLYLKSGEILRQYSTPQSSGAVDKPATQRTPARTSQHSENPVIHHP